jgi:toxin-antitoxin system PIN domain toxin
MLIPDINILVYAYDTNSPQHQQARKWWETTLSQAVPIGMAWVTMLGFIRITTHRSILQNPVAVSDALQRVQTWLEHPHVHVVSPGDNHARILFQLLGDLGTGGNLTTDAHLAALAIEYQAQLVSADADFSRFPGLRWFNPLAARQRIRLPQVPR